MTDADPDPSSVKLSIVSQKISEKYGERVRRTSRFFINNSLESPQGIDVLNQTSHVFLRPALPEEVDDVLDSAHLYKLLNLSGNVIFTAVKTFHYENCDKVLEFDITILEPNGGGVVSIKGNSENISICSLSFGGILKELLGSIHCPQRKRCSDENTILIRDSQNVVKLVIIPKIMQESSVDVKGEFIICSAEDKTITYGKFSSSWIGAIEDDSPVSKLCGVEFSEELDTNLKVLLMAALLLLYFQTYDSSQHIRKGALNNFQAIFCAIFSIIMFILTSLLVIAIIIKSV